MTSALLKATDMKGHSRRVLDPYERFSEIVFGLVMVLTFTCALGVAEAGREDVRAMLIGAIGCNLAWGIIDGAFYLIGCLVEKGRHSEVLRAIHRTDSPEEGLKVIGDAMPGAFAGALPAAEMTRLLENLRRQQPAPGRPRLTAENWRGALGVFLLVFLSTLPVVLPFLIFQDAWMALRLSNAVAIVMLFGSGYMLAGYSGLHRGWTGIAMVAIGSALVGVAIALGG